MDSGNHGTHSMTNKKKGRCHNSSLKRILCMTRKSTERFEACKLDLLDDACDITQRQFSLDLEILVQNLFASISVSETDTVIKRDQIISPLFGVFVGYSSWSRMSRLGLVDFVRSR